MDLHPIQLSPLTFRSIVTLSPHFCFRPFAMAAIKSRYSSGSPCAPSNAVCRFSISFFYGNLFSFQHLHLLYKHLRCVCFQNQIREFFEFLPALF